MVPCVYACICQNSWNCTWKRVNFTACNIAELPHFSSKIITLSKLLCYPDYSWLLRVFQASMGKGDYFFRILSRTQIHRKGYFSAMWIKIPSHWIAHLTNRLSGVAWSNAKWGPAEKIRFGPAKVSWGRPPLPLDRNGTSSGVSALTWGHSEDTCRRGRQEIKPPASYPQIHRKELRRWPHFHGRRTGGWTCFTHFTRGRGCVG